MATEGEAQLNAKTKSILISTSRALKKLGKVSYELLLGAYLDDDCTEYLLYRYAPAAK